MAEMEAIPSHGLAGAQPGVAPSTIPAPVGRLATWARFGLLALAVLIVAGAIGQFFLAGLAVFDSPLRWSDHATLGHILGQLAFLIWIPALVGRAGGRLIAASIVLAVLFGLQYAFIESDESTIQALHPLNGALLFALALWIARRAFVLVRRTSRSRDNAPGEGGVARDSVARDDRPGRGS